MHFVSVSSHFTKYIRILLNTKLVFHFIWTETPMNSRLEFNITKLKTNKSILFAKSIHLYLMMLLMIISSSLPPKLIQYTCYGACLSYFDIFYCLYMLSVLGDFIFTSVSFLKNEDVWNWYCNRYWFNRKKQDYHSVGPLKHKHYLFLAIFWEKNGILFRWFLKYLSREALL